MTNSTSPVRALVEHAEQQAQLIRRQAGLTPTETIDPLQIQDELGIQVAYPHEIHALPDEEREQLSRLDASVWSGMARPLPSGRLLVMLNPNQTTERKRVTVLEEVAHRHYGHPRTFLDGFSARDYNDPVEREAYWTAAAVLVPAQRVARGIFQRRSAESLAAEHGASVDLILLRIKVLLFWPAYQRYAAAGVAA